jgi:cytochrome P450
VPVYDPFDEAFQADPYPGYRTLRDHEPVHRHAKPAFWALSRFADIWAAVRDPATFSSAQGLTFHPDEIGRLGLAPTLVMLDPPRHGRLRALVSKGFTRGRVERLADEIRAFTRDRIDRMAGKAAEGEPVDLHRDFSSPIPTFVVARLLGVPEADRARFDPWVFALTSFQDNGFQVTDEPAVAAVAEMFGYFSDVVAARRTAPGDDLISALTVAEVDGERLSDWDILGFCFALVAGGNDTTSNLISHAVLLLDRHHDQRELLLSRPELLPGAILEFLRLESSVQGLARTTTRPVTLHGVTIPAGEKVLMLFGSGNHDEREFGPAADRLDVTRQFQRHLGFSGGVHFCIGSHLARLQAHIALTELFGRFPTIGVDVSNGRRIHSAYTRGWVSLPAVLAHA